MVVCEHFSAGGGLAGEDPAPLRREGRALLLALLDDLLALDGPPVAAVVGPDAARALPRRVEPLAGGEDPAEALARALQRGGGWAWPVGPETRGTAARLARVAERAAGGLVGTGSHGVRRAARRRSLLRRLRRAGVPVPETVEAPSAAAARRALERLGRPAVVKPGRGAGAAGTRRVEVAGEVEEAWRAAAAVDPGLPPLVQRMVPGTAASVTLLAAGDAGAPLALNRQRLRFTPRARYDGGATPLRHPDGPRALRTAAAAVRSCGGLEGLVGVDLVLGADGPVVLEVNPRVTTSYLGLRRHLGPGPAGAALRAAGHPGGGRRSLPPGAVPLDAEPVRFGTAGTPGRGAPPPGGDPAGRAGPGPPDGPAARDDGARVSG